jgi:hypothetical protein
METLEGNNITMIHDAKVLKEEVRHENIHDQNNIISLTNLAITQCIGKTNTNLDAIITRYADTIIDYNMRNLGTPSLIFVLDFSIFRCLCYHKIFLYSILLQCTFF